MRVKITVASALVDEQKMQWAGLAETVDVPDSRGQYLVSIGAAEEVKGSAKSTKAAEKPQKAAEKAPAPAPAPAPVQRRPQPKTK